MDCNAVRQLLPYLRGSNTELEAEDSEAVQAHLAGCADCAALAISERQFDHRIGRVLLDVPIPTRASARLVARLQRERRAWYRRRVVAPLAAAAGLLLAVTLGLHWLSTRGTVIDAERIVFDASAQIGAAPDQIENWFAARGVSVPVPADFEYSLLTSYDLVQFEGRDRVPRLGFERDRERAWVYVLRSSQFNLKVAREQQEHASGGYTLQVEEVPGRPDCVYLILYTGPTLKGFRREPPVGA